MPGHGLAEDQSPPFTVSTAPRHHLPGSRSVEELLVDILGQLESGRQDVINARWAELPLWDSEIASDLSGTATQLTVNASTRAMFRVSNILVSAPAAATNVVLRLGQRIAIPLPAGLSTPSVQLLLQPSDLRQLQWNGAGAAALLLMGQVVPTYGKVR